MHCVISIVSQSVAVVYVGPCPPVLRALVSILLFPWIFNFDIFLESAKKAYSVPCPHYGLEWRPRHGTKAKPCQALARRPSGWAMLLSAVLGPAHSARAKWPAIKGNTRGYIRPRVQYCCLEVLTSPLHHPWLSSLSSSS